MANEPDTISVMNRRGVLNMYASDLTDLIENVRKDALEEAARICEAQQKIFMSTQYAINQPVSSFGERFGCGSCAREIRKAGGIPDPHA